MQLNCLDCSNKSCKTRGADCFGLHDHSVARYKDGDTPRMVKSSSALIDNGRAGELSRFQEIIEFCKLQGYENVGLAYCFGLEVLAEEVRYKMESAGINILPARCTMGGVKEPEIDESKEAPHISCNPAGQAEFLNKRADFVVEIGLCLGHDVMFHQELKVPFTVLVVKDRVYSHNTVEAIINYKTE